jgi:hypothetical protein
MKNKIHLFIFSLFIFSLISCSKSDDDAIPKTDSLLGKWQLKTIKQNFDIKINGQVEKDSFTENGEPEDVIEIKPNNKISDPNDAFLLGIGAYEWDYKINGSEISVFDEEEVSYFTISQNGNKLIWSMNTEQTKKSLKDTKEYNLLLDLIKTAEITKFEYTLEFEKK